MLVPVIFSYCFNNFCSESSTNEMNISHFPPREAEAKSHLLSDNAFSVYEIVLLAYGRSIYHIPRQ